ncbi:FAD-dependent oxidoreductase [Halobellus ruber]|uniref:FAD-dependent monooxygenase n=1 Tax=Halobellus ruber TaxID=2761102 RepID=A0A7J9SK43_9EURY|nr:FAD-dependent monooxygenase [Halobellus ruber]MBB6647324.1 FAD-dependent monooxygenase [Halobellus ruber]
MTLSSASAYEAAAVPDSGDHAIVVGGSMAGLLTARVLIDGYDRVTLLERDPMTDEPVARRGIPQSQHVHVMLEPARIVLNDLFPGYQDEVRDEGALVLDAATELDYFDNGKRLADPASELPMLCASRPLFEQVVRRRVTDSPEIRIRDECQFVDYRSDDDATAVEGVRFRGETGEERTLSADLVVDATGRTSRTHKWLADNGYTSPPTDRVDVDLAYGTVTVDRPSEERRAYFCVPQVGEPKGGVAIPAEGDSWIVTLFGMHGGHPPGDIESYIDFADRLPMSSIADLLRQQEWVSEEVSVYPFPASQWRHYEALDRFPDGLVVTGDAIASFNPIYGQGMSVAALDALQLHHVLSNGAHDIGLRFFDRAETHLEVVWQVAVGGDFQFEETDGPKPFGTDIFNRYLSRLIDTAHDNEQVAEAFYRVLRLEERPTSLFHPRIAARVLLPS